MANILIVDDSNLSRRMSRRILESGGHKVRDVPDGLAALEQYMLERPDVILLDMTMAEMDGLEVLKQVLAIDPTARVVMATADVQSSTRVLAMQGGAVGYVTKPLVETVVLEAVAKAIEGVTP